MKLATQMVLKKHRQQSLIKFFENAKPVGISIDRCRSKIESNIHLFRSLWYAGAGHENFVQLYKNLSQQLTHTFPTEQQVVNFWSKWEELYGECTNLAMSRIYKLETGKNTHPGEHVKDFTNLLHTLCQ